MCNEAEPAVTEVDDGQVGDEHIHAVTLRPHGHNFTLHVFSITMARNSFVSQSLVKYV